MIGAGGFAILFRLPWKRMGYVLVGAWITCLLQLILESYMESSFSGTMLATVFAVWFSEIVARTKRLPATVLLTPMLVPLVPGGSLFYTMQAMLQGDWNAMQESGMATLQVGFGIAFGSLLAIAVVRLVTHARLS